MKKYRTSWTQKKFSGIFSIFEEEFDSFYDAVNYLSKVVSDNPYASNAAIHDNEKNECVCAFRIIK